MVCRIGDVPERVEISVTGECCPEIIGDDAAACDSKIQPNLSGHWSAVHRASCKVSCGTDSVKGCRWIAWVLHYDWFARSVGVRRSGRGVELVQVVDQGQVRALTADISYREYDVRRQLLLDVQVPLLHVRPNSFVGNGEWREREDWHLTCPAADAGIAAVCASAASAHAWGDV